MLASVVSIVVTFVSWTMVSLSSAFVVGAIFALIVVLAQLNMYDNEDGSEDVSGVRTTPPPSGGYNSSDDEPQ